MRTVTRTALASLVVGTLLAGCAQRPTPADLLLTNGNVYTLTWDEPGRDGAPAANAPHTAAGWKGDAQTVAIRDGKIVFVGPANAADRYRGEATRVIDVQGATVIPGLVDSHVHLPELGRSLNRVNLLGVATEAEAVDKVVAWAAKVPAGEWITGWGWDEGAWADHYPDMTLLSEKVPDHPVYLRGLHTYASWSNRLAFEKAGITAATPSPAGGEIRKGRDGKPTGILLNQASAFIERAIPAPTPEQLKTQVLDGLQAMARAGYVAVHEAGADTALMSAFESLNSEGKLQVRMYAMLSARDPALLKAWLAKGPDTRGEGMLMTRSVKVFADGALGSRGARLLADYADRPGHRGGSTDADFDKPAIAAMMKAGFQVAVHAIGDAANRETLDFIESVAKDTPSARQGRHRIEHAQVLHPNDIPRFQSLGVIASMQPAHAVEDMAWAADRLGPERVKGAYAWRTIRQTGAHLVFSSDLPATDYNIFYGLHSAVTRQDKQGQPAGGWHPEQRMTAEEALRGYTTWAAYSAFLENQTGVIAPGRWADLTVMDIDPLAVGEKDPARLLSGSILKTIVNGKVVFEKP